MLAHVESLVGCIDDDGVVGEVVLVEIFQQSAHALIYRGNHGHVVADVVLVFPLDQLLAGQVLAQELTVSWHVVGIDDGTLLWSHAVHLAHQSGIGISTLRSRWIVHLRNLQVAYHLHILVDRHLLGRCSRTTGRVIIPESFWQREVDVGILAYILGVRHPETVRCLVVNQQTEWLVLVAVVQVLNGMVGDEVGGVAHLLLEVTVLAGRSEGWVVVLTLVIQNMIVVESLRTAGHVPLAHYGSRIACPLQQF